MDESSKDISDLSPAQRELLLRRLERYVREGRAGAASRPAGQGDHPPAGRPLPSSLVPLQPLGSQRPFFCVHARRGGVSSYYHLARHLGTSRPFYGLQAKGLDGEEEPYESVEEMAAHYLRAVRAIQPEGPYAVGGWSFGGLVALEMAQQLAARREGVALLALIDTHAHTADGMTEIDTAGILYEILTSTLNIPPARLAGLELSDDLGLDLEVLQAGGVLPAGLDVKMFRGRVKVSKANHAALLSYVQKPYPGPVNLFQAAEGREVSLAEQRSRWESLTAAVDARVVPCEHNDLVNEPYVKILAGQLRECLEAAD